MRRRRRQPSGSGGTGTARRRAEIAPREGGTRLREQLFFTFAFLRHHADRRSRGARQQICEPARYVRGPNGGAAGQLSGRSGPQFEVASERGFGRRSTQEPLPGLHAVVKQEIGTGL